MSGRSSLEAKHLTLHRGNAESIPRPECVFFGIILVSQTTDGGSRLHSYWSYRLMVNIFDVKKAKDGAIAPISAAFRPFLS